MSEVHTLDLHFLSHKTTIGSFLIKAQPPEKGDILVESGPHSTLGALSEGLQAYGSSLSEVAHVFLSHIHLDHAGGAWALAERGAQIYVHPLGVSHLADPGRLMASAARIYGVDMDRLWGEMRPISPEKLHAAEDGAVFEVGGLRLQAHHSPGHARHHIAWQLGDALFAGDAAGVCIQGGPIIPPCPPPELDIPTWAQTLKKIKALAPRQLYLTHYGVIEQHISAHLDRVAQQLHHMLAWMRKALISEDPSKEDASSGGLEAAFEAYIRAQLRAAGLSSVTEEAYWAANPPFMSVLGLKRYLKQASSGRSS